MFDGSACADLKIPMLCLEIVRLIWTKLRSVLKMQIEAIINGVFVHTLHWALATLDGTNMPSAAIAAGTRKDSGASAAPQALVEPAVEEFSGETVSVGRLFSVSIELMDCIVDLLAETTLLPDLYVNYDCDGNRSDLTQTLFDLLAQVVQQSHKACNHTEDEEHFRWAQAIGELALRGLFNSIYVVYLRTQHQPKRGISISASANTGSEDSMDDELLEDATSPRFGSGFATADALYKKRQRKKFFQHGIQEFNRKPLAGIKYLQQNGFLPTPLDAKSLAIFLRSLPQGLNKNAVGMYLGAMGKEVKDFEKTDIHEADTMDFHRDVLNHFVQSFNFEGESIVTALRMFLASFRLPGEAQQIDRILNCFSLQIYEQGRERFLMASVDVAYLLSFSLIMLNTDLHNPNIRPEKKMKVEDFIKNNKNYGAEVSHNQDLPDDFLVDLYMTISTDEIKTFEDGGKNGEVTSDRWKDLLNQAESDPKYSRLIVHHQTSAHTNGQHTKHARRMNKRQLKTSTMKAVETALRHRRASAGSSHELEEQINEGAENDDQDRTILNDQAQFDGNQYDRHIFELVQPTLVRAFASVFQQFVNVSKRKLQHEADKSPSGVIDLSDAYLPAKSMLQLACNAFVLCAGSASHLSLHEHFNSTFVLVCKYTGLFASDIYPSAYNGREDGAWLFGENESAPLATAAMLKLAGTCSLSLQSDSWKCFFHVLSALREFRALPEQILHPSDLKLDLMTPDECNIFISLVHQNKIALEHRQALRAKELSGIDGANSSGSFFSGVAWLMSALDASINGASTDPRSPSSSFIGEFDIYSPHNPKEFASHAHDLVHYPDAGGDNNGSGRARNSVEKQSFDTDDWIRLTFQPYRLEYLLQDISNLPSRGLAQVIQALHEDIVRGLGGGAVSADGVLSVGNAISPGGCVLLEHILGQILASSVSLFNNTDDDDEDNVWKVLEDHYTQILELVAPMLDEESGNGVMDYESACFLLQKAINSLFAWTIKMPSNARVTYLMTFLRLLVEFNGDDSDELIMPFVAPILCGLGQLFSVVKMENLSFDVAEWTTVCDLIGWSTTSAHGASHGFALLDRLVQSRMWTASGTALPLSGLYAKALLFALKPNSTGGSDSVKRPKQLLFTMFTSASQQNESNDTEQERLRFLGGMIMVCRQHVLDREHVSPTQQQELNEQLVAGLEFMKQEMLGSRTDSYSMASCMDVLAHGLLPLGREILSGQPALEMNDPQSSESAVLHYQHQLRSHHALAGPPATTGKAPAATTTTGRRRRPSVVKDPLALRPHVMMVQLVSWVLCQQLDQLVACESFASLWSELVELLLDLLEYTATRSDSTSTPSHAVNGEMLATLERRSMMSTHEEILEHIKGIVRRLTALNEVDGQDTGTSKIAPPQSDVDASSAQDQRSGSHALVHMLVAKCQTHPGLFDQLFPSSEEDTSSSEEQTSPMAEESSDIASMIANEAMLLT